MVDLLHPANLAKSLKYETKRQERKITMSKQESKRQDCEQHGLKL